MNPRLAPDVIVEEGATVGDGTVVWNLTQIRAGATIGAACVIGRNVFIDAGVVVGDRCKIQNNVLVYAPARLDDGVFVGPAAVLTNDRYPRAVNPDGTTKAALDWKAEGVHLGSGASIGAGAVVLSGVDVGAWALVAANAMVTRDVAAFALVAGVPARRIAWVGRAGRRLRHAGGVTWQCPETGATYVEDEVERLSEQ